MVILTHVRPDGDALGSAAALTRAGIRSGKEAIALEPAVIPARYRFLLNDLPLLKSSEFPGQSERSDTIVIVDTCSEGQLGDIADQIAQVRDKTVVIDHHLTRDDIGAVQWVDTSAAAAGVMVFELMEELNWEMDLPIMEALATAVLTDTGWFRFSNSDSRATRILANLLDGGVRIDEIYGRVYQNARIERLRLKARALESLELLCDSRLAVMTLRIGDFSETGATQDETEDLVNEPMQLGSVQVSLMLVEESDGPRASLRSRGTIDVARIASKFAGGGHAKAAGCSSKGESHTFREQLIAACTQALLREGK